MTNPSPKSTLKRYPAGSIFQGFGENKVDYAPVGYPDGHGGWDILAYQGAPIVAATSGEVVFINNDPKAIGGLYIRLISGDGKIMTTYGHLQKLLVSLGDRVREGQQIGEMGNTGFIISGGTKFWGNAPAGKGVHLHFAIYPIKNWKGGMKFTKVHSNGTDGAVDPTPFFAETIKPEIPDQKDLLVKLIELYRSLIRKLGKEPVA